MIILIVLVVVLIVGIIVSGSAYDPVDFIGVAAAFTAGILLLIFLIALPMNRYGVYKDIKKFNATKTTVELSRTENPKLENAAIQHKIVECNQWLAGVKYDNEIIWDIWIPDEVMELEPIK